MRVFTPSVRVREGDKLAQIEFKPGFYLQGEAFSRAASQIKSYPDLTLLSQTSRSRREAQDGIVLHTGNKIKVHDGNMLEWGKDNTHCFDEVDITDGYVLNAQQFCLIPSLEYMTLPSTCAGWLWDANGHYNPIVDARNSYRPPGPFMIHPNAPLIAAGSDGNQILEVWHTYQTLFMSRREERPPYPLHLSYRLKMCVGKPIAIMSLHSLDQEAEKPYEGRYKGQRGPQISLSHLDTR